MKCPFLRVTFGLAVVFFMTGCGESKTELEGLVPVSGTITQGGSPLVKAVVTFNPTNPSMPGEETIRAASAFTDETGHYELTTLTPGDGAAPGDYQVTVTKIEITGKTYTAEEAQAYVSEHGSPPPSSAKNLVDEKYSKVVTSGLTATVSESGPNDFPFTVD